MYRKKKSKIWLLPHEQFAELVASNNTLTGISKGLGLFSVSGASHKVIKSRIALDGLDMSHITLGRNNLAGKKRFCDPTPMVQILVENCPYSRSTIKRRLLKDGIFENRCSLCGLGGEWNGKPISMRLDHINGIHNDGRLDNLRMICPNCDSQLPTFSGANRKYEKRLCKDCGKEVYRSSERCKSCSFRMRIGKVKTKIEWPSSEELAEMIRSTNRNQVAEKLGVSWNGLQHRLEIHQISV